MHPFLNLQNDPIVESNSLLYLTTIIIIVIATVIVEEEDKKNTVVGRRIIKNLIFFENLFWRTHSEKMYSKSCSQNFILKSLL